MTTTDKLLQEMANDKDKLRWYEKVFNKLREILPQEQEIDLIKETGGFFVRKQTDGTYRWFGIVTNKFVDLEDEILTDSAHVEFLNYLDQNPEKAPELWIWHTPGTARKNRADWWEYTNGFFMYSGELTEIEGEQYENIESKPVGMSHGFLVLGKEGKYITRYRTFEVSELPLEVAANPYTLFSIETEEDIMKFSENKRLFLSERLGEEVVAQLENTTENAEKVLEDAGVDWKQLNAEYEAEIEEKLAERVQKASEVQVATIVKAVVKAVRDDLEVHNENVTKYNEKVEGLLALVETVNELVEDVKHLKDTKDAWIAEAIAPSNPFVNSPTKSEKNVVDEEDMEAELVKQAKEALATEAPSWMKRMVPGGR